MDIPSVSEISFPLFKMGEVYGEAFGDLMFSMFNLGHKKRVISQMKSHGFFLPETLTQKEIFLPLGKFVLSAVSGESSGPWDKTFLENQDVQENFVMLLFLSRDSLTGMKNEQFVILLQSITLISGEELVQICSDPQKILENMDRIVPSTLLEQRQQRLNRLTDSPCFEYIRSVYHGDRLSRSNWITFPIDPLEDVLLNMEKYTPRELLYISEALLSPDDLLQLETKIKEKLVRRFRAPLSKEYLDIFHQYHDDKGYIMEEHSDTLIHVFLQGTSFQYKSNNSRYSWFLPIRENSLDPNIFQIAQGDPENYTLFTISELTSKIQGGEFLLGDLPPLWYFLHGLQSYREIRELTALIEIYYLEQRDLVVVDRLKSLDSLSLNNLKTLTREIKVLAASPGKRENKEISRELAQLTLGLSREEFLLYDCLPVGDYDTTGRFIPLHIDHLEDILKPLISRQPGFRINESFLLECPSGVFIPSSPLEDIPECISETLKFLDAAASHFLELLDRFLLRSSL